MDTRIDPYKYPQLIEKPHDDPDCPICVQERWDAWLMVPENRGVQERVKRQARSFARGWLAVWYA